jgi:hypothetical protein
MSDCQLLPYTRENKPYSKKDPFSKKTKPYSTIIICPFFLLQENGFSLLQEDGNKIKLE